MGGAIAPRLDPGDIVVATSVIGHDCVISSESGTELMAPGELFLSLAPAARLHPPIVTNASLSERLTASLDPPPVQGLVLSGNEFVGAKARKAALLQTHPDALLVDMESVGGAQIARRLGVPFAVIRTVADRAAPSDTLAHNYLDWVAAASNKAGQVINILVRVLGETPPAGAVL